MMTLPRHGLGEQEEIHSLLCVVSFLTDWSGAMAHPRYLKVPTQNTRNHFVLLTQSMILPKHAQDSNRKEERNMNNESFDR